MDACAVAAARGVAGRFTTRQALLLTGAFGLFQAVMPAIGWVMGLALRSWVLRFAPWITFVLLAIIGGKMAYEGWRGEDDEAEDGRNPFALSTVLLLAIATSIDALAVGVGLSLLEVSLPLAAGIIGVVTFALSLLAMYAGRWAGDRLAGRLDILGGVILIGIGTKILLSALLAPEH